MGHVVDRWTVPGPNNRRVKGPRYGQGKRWLARWEEAGSRKSRAFETKDAATLHLSQVAVDQNAGVHVLTSRATVAEYGAQWVRSQIHHRPATAEQLEMKWRLYVDPVLGSIRLQDLTRAQVQAAVVKWRETLAPATTRLVYSFLASMLRSAVLSKDLGASPCVRINLPIVEDVMVVPLTVAQVHRIASEVPPQYRAMVLLAAATGLRSGELRGLTADRLMFLPDGLRLRIDRQLATTAPTWGPPKTEKSSRTVMVGERTADMMRRHLAEFPPHPSGIVFTGREHEPMNRSTASGVWGRATVGMNLKDRSGWHELRHHHASLLIAAGLSPTAVAHRLGHKDATETLRTYAHLWEDDDARSVRAVEGALWPVGVPDLSSGETPGNHRRLSAVQ
jgi:integrase